MCECERGRGVHTGHADAVVAPMCLMHKLRSASGRAASFGLYPLKGCGEGSVSGGVQQTACSTLVRLSCAIHAASLPCTTKRHSQPGVCVSTSGVCVCEQHAF